MDDLVIGPMQAQDLPAGMRLKENAGWNQTGADWWVMFDGYPRSCFVARVREQVVGTVAALAYTGQIGWVGMMLVDPAWRRRGIGSRLMQQALVHLAGYPLIMLDATPLGKQLYDRFGFGESFTLHRLTCRAVPPLPAAVQVEPATEADLPALIHLDATVFGAARAPLIRYLFHRSHPHGWLLRQNGGVAAACLGRPGSKYYQLGPLIAGNIRDAESLLTTSLNWLTGRPAVIDVPDGQPAWQQWLTDLGFAPQRPFIRMTCGRVESTVETDRLFAIAGPEFG